MQFDRRKREIIDEAGVIAKFGVGPASIPDYLGLVGDTADGFPGLPGWGAKSAAAVLARYGHLEDIPPSVGRVGRARPAGAGSSRPRCRSQIDAGAPVPQHRHRRARRRRSATVDDWAGPARPLVSAPSPSGSARPNWRGAPSGRPSAPPARSTAG